MANDNGLEKISEVPLEFIKEGTTFINRCTKPDAPGMYLIKYQNFVFNSTMFVNLLMFMLEFIKIVRAVGVGFVVMGAIGYLVKLVCITFVYISLP